MLPRMILFTESFVSTRVWITAWLNSVKICYYNLKISHNVYSRGYTPRLEHRPLLTKHKLLEPQHWYTVRIFSWPRSHWMAKIQPSTLQIVDTTQLYKQTLIKVSTHYLPIRTCWTWRFELIHFPSHNCSNIVILQNC